jgi:hypothetical protein
MFKTAAGRKNKDEFNFLFEVTGSPGDGVLKARYLARRGRVPALSKTNEVTVI